MYQVVSDIHGCQTLEVPLTSEGLLDIDATSALKQRPKIIFVCNPNNPTGSVQPDRNLERLLDTTEGQCIVAVDEAYIEFCRDKSLVSKVAQYPHLVVMRTMSKAFGLAGLHVGFALADSHVIRTLQKISNPYPIPDPCAQIALSALSDDGIKALDENISEIIRIRDNFSKNVKHSHGFRRQLPSFANFVLAEFDDADDAMKRLKTRGVIARRFRNVLGCDEWVRFSIGTESQMDIALAALA